MQSTARGGSLVTAWGIALLLSLTSHGVAASVAAAAPADPILDVELEVDSAPAGSTVTLTARVFDDAGQPLTGPGSNTTIRFYFAAGSANDPGGNGGNADLQCRTGQAGTCAVAYVPANQGIDTICAKTSNGAGGCDEPVDATERIDGMDTVRRTITEPAPSPDGSPLPTPSPSADPSAVPSDDPAPGPEGSPSPSPASSPAPTDEPSPSPSAEPTPAPSPSADPSPVPSDDPAPGPDGSPSPSPDASPAPTDEPSPSPSAEPTASPSPSPDPAPPGRSGEPPGKPDDTPGGGPKASHGPSGDPTPTPSPDPTPIPSPDPTPTPSPDPTPTPSPDPSATPAGAASPSPSADPSTNPSPDPSTDTPGDPFVAALPPADRGGDDDPSGGRPGGTDGTPGAVIPPARSPSEDFGGVVDAIVSSAVDGMSTVLRSEAAATVATSFGFPIALALVVMLFLVLQSRMDDRDPKLRSAPRSMADTLVAFEDDRG